MAQNIASIIGQVKEDGKNLKVLAFIDYEYANQHLLAKQLVKVYNKDNSGVEVGTEPQATAAAIE